LKISKGDVLTKITIDLDPEYMELLKGLKQDPNDSYDLVIQRMIHNAYDWEELSEEDMKEIEEGLQEMKEGKTVTFEEIEEDLRKRKEETCIP
jgi:predicted transcriptional regulator